MKNNKLIKILLFTVFCLLFTAFAVHAQDTVLKTGISIDKVPHEFYGTWRVSSALADTNEDGLFRENSVDLWNLSRAGNVITLVNPFSGAHASISVDEINNKTIKFRKVGAWDKGQKLTDIVEMTLSKNSFTGVNYLKLDTIDENGHVTKSSKATYRLRGEKIAGESIK